jgi:hypothetical protein
MSTITVTLGHPEGSHKHLAITVRATSQASLPQEINITDQQGQILFEHTGHFDFFEETKFYENVRSLFLAVTMTHSEGKDHWDIKTERLGPWQYKFSCEDGFDRDYNDLIVTVTATPKGFI